MSTKFASGFLKVFLLALILLILEGNLVLSNGAELAAKYTNKPISIDGQINESAWNSTSFTTYATHPIANDSTTANVKLLWDEKYLYAAIDVTDEYVETASQEWNDDSVTLTMKNGIYASKNRQDIRGTGEGAAVRAVLPKSGTIIDNNSNIDAGFTIEMKIPWSSIMFIPNIGGVVNIDFLSVDHDKNPGGNYYDPATVFSKLSWDGDKNPDTTLNALVLEGIDTPPAQSATNPPNTDNACDFYGFDAGLRSGDVISLKDSLGNELGYGTLNEDGKYGFVTALGDDLETVLDEGFTEDETVYIYKNGSKLPYAGKWHKGATMRLDSLVNTNKAPTFYNIGNQTGPATKLLQFSVMAYDADGDFLTWKSENLPEGSVFDSSNAEFSWTPTAYEAGTYVVYFEVSDGINEPIGQYVSINITTEKDLVSIEAEDLTNLNHEIIYDVSIGAWANAYVITTNFKTSSHNFVLPKYGNYTIWVRMSGISDNSDAVKLNIDSKVDLILGDETGNNYSGFKWVNFKNGDVNNKISLLLYKGKHVLNLVDCEAGVKIDSIIITNNFSYLPTEIPPNISTGSWENVVSDGFGDIKNHEAKLMQFEGALYASTSNANLHPAIFKSEDGENFEKVYELKTPYSHGYYMYRTLDLKYLDIGDNSGLYALSDDWYGSCYLTYMNQAGTFSTLTLGNRDWWAKDMISFGNFVYAGFYNDWNLWFTMRKTASPMNLNIKTSWQAASLAAFGKDASGKQHANMDAESSCVFKGYLYVGTYNNGYFGRTTTGAQIWRTNDGTNWQQVVGNGFGSTSRSSISQMVVFGGYLYATTAIPFGSNYIYRTKDGTTWELAFQGMGNEPYFGDITTYMGRLYITTYNWGGRVYSSLDGKIWTPVSDHYINNDSTNSLVGDLEIFKGALYVNTRNGKNGTNVFRAEIE